ncbi:hypothetical protein CR513_49520, partial [Mucuna pruriens]
MTYHRVSQLWLVMQPSLMSYQGTSNTIRMKLVSVQSARSLMRITKQGLHTIRVWALLKEINLMIRTCISLSKLCHLNIEVTVKEVRRLPSRLGIVVEDLLHSLQKMYKSPRQLVSKQGVHGFIKSLIEITLRPLEEPLPLVVLRPLNPRINTRYMLKLLVSSLEYNLIVDTLANGYITTSSLFANHVLINYSNKSIIFGTLIVGKDRRSITTNQAKIFLREDAQVYMILSILKVEKNRVVTDVPMVRDFPELFFEDINLVLRIGPISIEPYRMSPLELVRLKKQLEELIEK